MISRCVWNRGVQSKQYFFLLRRVDVRLDVTMRDACVDEQVATPTNH